MMSVFSLLFPFCFIAILNCGTIIATRHQFGECMPVTLFIITACMYLSQYLFNTFKIAFVIAGISTAAVLFYFIRCLLFRHSDQRLRGNIFSYGWYFFLLLMICLSVYDFHRHFQVSDEFTHWGKMVKEMMRLDHFYSVPESTLLVHKDYPPFTSLFEVFWCSISGGFSEARCSMALHFLMMSVFPGALELRKSNRKGLTFAHCLLLLFLVTLTGYSFDGDGIFQTIYVDYFIAAWGAYAFYLMLSKKAIQSRFGLFSWLCTTSFIVMGKEVGLFFFLLNVFCFDEIEFSNLLSYPRYMGSWIFFELLVIIAIFFSNKEKQYENMFVLITAACIFATFNSSSLIHMEPQILRGDPYAQYREESQIMNDNSPPGSKILVIDAGEDIVSIRSFFLDGGRTILGQSRWTSDDAIGTFLQDSSDLKELIGDSDFVFVSEAGEKQRELFHNELIDDAAPGTMIDSNLLRSFVK